MRTHLLSVVMLTLLLVPYAAAPALAFPSHFLYRKHHTHIATISMLRRRLKIGMDGPKVERALHGLTFLSGGEAIVQAGPSGSSVEVDTYPCRNGTVQVVYSRLLYGQKASTAKVISISGPHFFTGDASSAP